MTRIIRPRRIFLTGALVLLATFAVAALVFREGIREQWLLWRLDHSGAEAEKACMTALGALGSLRAIEPLARRLEGLPPSYAWHFHTTINIMQSLDALSALLSIARARREKCLPHLERSMRGAGGTAHECLRQLYLVAMGAQEDIDLSKPLVPGRDPRVLEE